MIVLSSCLFASELVIAEAIESDIIFVKDSSATSVSGVPSVEVACTGAVYGLAFWSSFIIWALDAAKLFAKIFAKLSLFIICPADTFA